MTDGFAICNEAVTESINWGPVSVCARRCTNILWCVPQLSGREGGQRLSPDADGCCGSLSVPVSRIWSPFPPHPFQWQASLFSVTSVWSLSQTLWPEHQALHKHSKAETTVMREKRLPY